MSTAGRIRNNAGIIMGFLALVVALDGPAWAVRTINGAKIKASSITTKQIKNSTLKGADVRNGSLSGVDVKDASLTGADVADGSIDGADVKDASIAAGDIAPGVIPTIPEPSVPDGSVTTAKFAADAVAPSALALPGFRTQANDTSPNVLGGFTDNTITSGVFGASLLGGGVASFLQKVTDDYGTVAGGRGNTAGNNTGTTSDALGATVGGGEGNSATASYATVPGGLSNTASGTYSLAAGRRAKALNNGSFVWADSTNADFSSTVDNQFAIRAANGMFLANDAGGSKTVPIGTRYRDNAIVAWARVTSSGGLDSNFNVQSVEHVSTGFYRFTLNSSLSSGFSTVPVVTPEVDPDGMGNPPTGAASVRIAVANLVAAGNTFDVYMYNGSFALTDNDFQVLVTGR